MIVRSKFSFLPDYPVYVSKFKADDGIAFIDFPMQYIQGNDENIAKELLKIFDNRNDFGFKAYHDDDTGIEFKICEIERISLIVKAQDSLDVSLEVSYKSVFEGDTVGELLFPGNQRTIRSRIITGFDCNIDIVSQRSISVPKTIYSIEFIGERDIEGFRGEVHAYNKTLSQEGESFLDAIDGGSDYSITLGIMPLDESKPLLKLNNVKFDLKRRQIKDGLDRVELLFRSH